MEKVLQVLMSGGDWSLGKSCFWGTNARGVDHFLGLTFIRSSNRDGEAEPAAMTACDAGGVDFKYWW